MASFDKYSNFKDDAGVTGVVFGSEKPVLEVELNEMQDALKSQMRRVVKNILGDGISDLSKITYANGIVSVASGCFLSLNGYVANCTGLSVTAGNSSTVYLQAWEETVDSSATLKTEGNQQSSSTVANWAKDSRSPVETSRRKVMKYTLATSQDSSKYNLAIAQISATGVITRVCKEVSYTKLAEQVIDLRAQMGTIEEGVLGVEIDLDNNTFKRIGDNEYWNGGSDYDQSEIYGKRVRCNVTDTGVIVAEYGDEAYTETGALTVAVTIGETTYAVGTKVQAMVKQPQFYYKRIPMRLTKQVDSTYAVSGFHLTKWVDLISPVPREGFKLHPVFILKSSSKVTNSSFYFIGENDGSIETSTGYDLTDSATLGSSPYAGLKFSSIAGAKPASGATNNLTISAIRQLCTNRNDLDIDSPDVCFTQEDILIASAEQMLFTIEYATMNIQNCSVFGAGITNLPYVDNTNDSVPCPLNTTLGNGSGKITTSYTHSNGTSYNVDVPVYRGVKNPFGNIWKFIENFKRKNASGSNNAVMICYAPTGTDTDNDYEFAGFSSATAEGYAKAIGYSEDCDFTYITSKVGGDSNRPIGDYHYTNMALNTYIALLGARWSYGALSGLFSWTLSHVSSTRSCGVGGRLCAKAMK